jgi:hypothetical protein
VTDLPPGAPDDDAPAGSQQSALPFLVAIGLVAVLGTFAVLFLRSDDEGELVRPDRIDALDATTVRAVVLDEPGCRHIDRAQVDYDDDLVLFELVAVDVADCADGERVDVVAEITLPEPLDGRDLRAGVGRTRLPCSGDGATVTCAPER